MWRHWAGLLSGPTATVILLVWQVFAKTNIPPWVFWLVALTGIPLAGFLAWREEHRKLAAEGDSELRELASRMVEKYVTLAESHKDEGPHSLAELNLAALGSDALIRKTIYRMFQRIGRDPWEGWAGFVDDVDLVAFFTWIRDHRLNLHMTKVDEVAKQVKAAAQTLARLRDVK